MRGHEAKQVCRYCGKPAWQDKKVCVTCQDKLTVVRRLIAVGIQIKLRAAEERIEREHAERERQEQERAALIYSVIGDTPTDVLSIVLPDGVPDQSGQENTKEQ